jgi:hypothetical protein
MPHLQNFSLVAPCPYNTDIRTRRNEAVENLAQIHTHKSDISVSASQILRDARIKYTIPAFHTHAARWREKQMLLRESIECVTEEREGR